MTKKITQQQLAEKYGVTQAFVSKSIHGHKNSPKSIKIRRDYGRALRSLAETFIIKSGRLAA